MTKIRLGAALIGLSFALAGCSGGQPPSEGVDREQVFAGDRTKAASSLSDIPGLFGDDGASGDGLTPVNRYLWKASLDTLAYLPLASTDPFTGVVATDWAASPDAPDERFKVTAYVKSAELSARSLVVAVYREVRNETGGWATAPVSGETARRLEDAILLRARQLRIEDREGDLS